MCPSATLRDAHAPSPMYTKRIYSLPTLIAWTRYETLLILVIAAVPVVIFEVLDQRWLYLPWLPIALVGTAVAFILSFQNNAAYDRSWEARKIWGGITNSSRKLGAMANDFVTNLFADEPASEDELRAIRKRIVMRHVAWMTALRYTLRSPRPWEQRDLERTNREWAERIGVHEHRVPLEDDIRAYVQGDEAHLVCGSANAATQLIAQQSRELQRLRQRGLIDDFRHMEMQSVLNELLDGQGKSERIKNFPYPRQYATLNAAFLWIFIVLIPFGLVHEFAEIGVKISDAAPGPSAWFIWLSIPFSAVVMWVFHTMERIGRVTENPFEGTPNDVPITTMARGIEIDLRQMIGDDPSEIPGPIPPKHHAQT